MGRRKGCGCNCCQQSCSCNCNCNCNNSCGCGSCGLGSLTNVLGLGGCGSNNPLMTIILLNALMNK